MTGISDSVARQYFAGQNQVIRLAPTQPQLSAAASSARKGTCKNAWTVDEHNRFLEALQRFPSGPWRYIAMHVGTRTTRQTMAHAQKYRERIARLRQSQGADGPAETSHTQQLTIPPRTCSAGSYTTEFEADLALIDDVLVGVVHEEEDGEHLLQALDSTLEEMPPFSHEEAQWMVEHCSFLSLDHIM